MPEFGHRHTFGVLAGMLQERCARYYEEATGKPATAWNVSEWRNGDVALRVLGVQVQTVAALESGVAEYDPRTKTVSIVQNLPFAEQDLTKVHEAAHALRRHGQRSGDRSQRLGTRPLGTDNWEVQAEQIASRFLLGPLPESIGHFPFGTSRIAYEFLRTVSNPIDLGCLTDELANWIAAFLDFDLTSGSPREALRLARCIAGRCMTDLRTGDRLPPISTRLNYPPEELANELIQWGLVRASRRRRRPKRNPVIAPSPRKRPVGSVFVSAASVDRDLIVPWLDRLRITNGIEFIDRPAMQPTPVGAPMLERRDMEALLRTQVGAADKLLLFATGSAEESDWVRMECHLAQILCKPIIPCVLDPELRHSTGWLGLHVGLVRCVWPPHPTAVDDASLSELNEALASNRTLV